LKPAVSLVALALSGCVAVQPVSAPLPMRIIPVSDGLKIADSGGQQISFKRTQAGVETAVSRLIGAPATERRRIGNCEVVGWENGLTLIFENAAFAGWVSGPPGWQEPRSSAGNTCGRGAPSTAPPTAISGI